MKWIIILITLGLQMTCNKFSAIEAYLYGTWMEIETLTIVNQDTFIRNSGELNHTIILKKNKSFVEKNHLVPNQQINTRGKWKMTNANVITFYEIITIPHDSFTIYADFEYEIIKDTKTTNEIVFKNPNALIFTKYKKIN